MMRNAVHEAIAFAFLVLFAVVAMYAELWVP